MKIGNVLVFLAVALIALGFLMSDDINRAGDLNDCTKTNTNLQTELETTGAKLGQALARASELQQTANNQAGEIKRLEQENAVLKGETARQKLQLDILNFNPLKSTQSDGLGLVLLLPLLLVSLVTTCVIIYKYMPLPTQKPVTAKDKRGTYILVSEDERMEVIRARRAK
ncbi:MAG TPA: hypothetical protein VGK00_11090 [Anaerolineales bacterium]|jgi:flagellar biosynthesis protein FliP